MLKSDHFLADANWEMVEKTTEIENPYRNIAESVHVSVTVWRVSGGGVCVRVGGDWCMCIHCSIIIANQ